LLGDLTCLDGRQALLFAGHAQHVGEFQSPQAGHDSLLALQQQGDGIGVGRGLAGQEPADDHGVVEHEGHQSRPSSPAHGAGDLLALARHGPGLRARQGVFQQFADGLRRSSFAFDGQVVEIDATQIR
jgi:hypothetical protein